MLLVIANSREEADAIGAAHPQAHAIVQGQVSGTLQMQKMRLNTLVNLVPPELRDAAWLGATVLPYMEPGFQELDEMPGVAEIAAPEIMETLEPAKKRTWIGLFRRKSR